MLTGCYATSFRGSIFSRTQNPVRKTLYFLSRFPASSRGNLRRINNLQQSFAQKGKKSRRERERIFGTGFWVLGMKRHWNLRQKVWRGWPRKAIAAAHAAGRENRQRGSRGWTTKNRHRRSRGWSACRGAQPRPWRELRGPKIRVSCELQRRARGRARLHNCKDAPREVRRNDQA